MVKSEQVMVGKLNLPKTIGLLSGYNGWVICQFVCPIDLEFISDSC